MLRQGVGSQNGKLRIFEQYQKGISKGDAVKLLKQEYGTGGRSYTFLDGSSGFVDFRPAKGFIFWWTPKGEKIAVSWTNVEKRLRQLIKEDNYLTPKELAKVQAEVKSDGLTEELTPAPREITQADIDAALREWNGDLDSKRRVQQYMTDHARERETAAWLQDEYGDDLPAFPVNGEHTGTDLSWTKVQRHLARLVKEDRFFTEAELENFNDIDAASVREQLQQSQTSAFVEQVKTDVEQLPEEENPAPSVRDSYEHYKPLVKEQVLADQAYQNACVNSDRETALMEGNEAIKRAAQSFVDAEDMTFVRLYSDMAEFHSRLHREILDETYPVLSQSRQEQNAEKTYTVSTVPTIFCEWSESPVFEDGKTYSLSEFDRLMRQADDEFTAGKKAAMEKYGTWQNWYDAKDVELSRFLGYNKVKFTLIMPDGRTFTERQDIGDGDGGVLDFLSQYDAYRDMIPILRQAVQREQEPPDLSGQPITREGDTITIGGGDTTHKADITISDKQWQEIQAVIPDAAPPARDPMAPAYNVGDKVYLDNTEYIIEDISPFDVQLRDPAQAYPILRAETKGQFEKALWKDSRNGHITEFMPADLGQINEDFREVLTSGLLSERDKDYISDWLRSGESNTRIAQRLSEQFAGQTDTFMLKTGEHADYFASAISIEVHILDEEDNKKAAFSRTWQEAAPLLRALWQQELDGFSHTLTQRDPVWLEGQPAYQIGDKVSFQYGNREITGTIG